MKPSDSRTLVKPAGGSAHGASGPGAGGVAVTFQRVKGGPPRASGRTSRVGPAGRSGGPPGSRVLSPAGAGVAAGAGDRLARDGEAKGN